MNTAQIPVERYEPYVDQFNPVRFDADAWARMAKSAGMKYIVITSKHHDGLCLELQPDVIVNNRVDKGRGGMAGITEDARYAGDYGTPEQEIPATGLPGVDWETCMTMNRHWGYNRLDLGYKSSEQLIRMLVDIASKGGNYLLNVGPTPEGLFPPR